jgi:hypothetical protein
MFSVPHEDLLIPFTMRNETLGCSASVCLLEEPALCGVNIRLEPVNLNHLHNSDELLSFFMGKNTPERQDFIIGNLRIEKDLVEV